ncbi:AAA family ATPase [Candidatus Giovannonibacteria bacterium]|nr:AAA family ATPase [Candidatus Giovannonibacteria bacterium]
MLIIKRYLGEKISKNLGKKKILIIYGARQVGKTTLVKDFLYELFGYFGKTLYYFPLKAIFFK